MQVVESWPDETQTLHRRLRDLVTLLAMPGAWTNRDPHTIAEDLADVLINVLSLDLVYIFIKDISPREILEIARMPDSANGRGQARRIGALLEPYLNSKKPSLPHSISNPVGNGVLHITTAPIGQDRDYGIVIAGSQRPDFPSETEQLLLSIGASQIAITLQQLNLLKEAEEDLKAQASQQTAVAELGQQALAGLDLPALMDEAVTCVAQTLQVEYCKVLELLPDGQKLLLRAGVGWHKGLVGRTTVDAGIDSQAGYTLLVDEPVVVEDLRVETRFKGPALLHEHGVISGLSVIIQGQERPFGVLGAHTTKKRVFTQDDVHFLQAAANILAAAIERKRVEASLQASNNLLQAIIEGTTDAIFVKDLQGRYLVMNSAGADIIGKPVEEIVGQIDTDVLPAKMARIVKKEDQRVLEIGRPETFEMSIVTGGKKQILHSLKAPYWDMNGNIIGIIGVSRDISELKQVEAGQRLLAEAGKILADSIDYSTRLANVAQLAVPELADWCAVYIIDEEESYRQVAVAHVDPAKVELARQLQQRYPPDINAKTGPANVIRTGQSELYPEIPETLLEATARDAEHLQLIRELQIKSAMVTPLIARGRTLGAMTFISAESGRHYDQHDLALAEELARRAALAVENARLYQAEQKARQEAEAAQQHLALLAETRERNRLAQELHDNVAQALGYLNLKIGMTNMLLEQGELKEVKANLQELKNVISEAYTDVREEIFNLRAKVSVGLGFLEMLDRYIDKYRRFYKLDIQLVKDTDETLFEFPPEVGPQIIRTIQEALINVRKHAKVDKATIRLWQEGDQVCITVEDKGQGFDPAKLTGPENSSFGLQIMRERVRSVGGNFEIESKPGQGTRIVLRYSIN